MFLFSVFEVYIGFLFLVERRMFEIEIVCNFKDVKKSNFRYFFKIYFIDSYFNYLVEY